MSDIDSALDPGQVPALLTTGRLVAQKCASKWPEHLLRERLALVGVPRQHVGRRLDEYQLGNAGHQDALASVVAALPRIEDRSASLFVAGGAGSGKTHLLVGVLAALAVLHRRWRIAYASALGLVSEHRRVLLDRSGAGQEAWLDRVQRLESADLCAIDELSTAVPDAVATELDAVLRARSDAMKPTLVAGRQPRGKLAQRYSALGDKSYVVVDVPSEVLP